MNETIKIKNNKLITTNGSIQNKYRITAVKTIISLTVKLGQRSYTVSA